jgi:hypothetical protein
MIAARGRGKEREGWRGRPRGSIMACLSLEFSASHLMGSWCGVEGIFEGRRMESESQSAGRVL